MTKKNITYNEAMQELSAILEGLEAETIDVDEVSSRVKRAGELIKFCKERIEKTEMEVRNIAKELEQDSQSEK